MKAMILAAGLGTRLRPQTLKLPKPAIPLLNVPLIGYSMYLLRAAGVKDLACNTHHLPQIMKRVVQRMAVDFSSLHFSDEEGIILGSAGGLKHAERFLQGSSDVLLANGDEVFFPKNPDVLGTLVKTRQARSALATLLVQEHPLVGKKFGGVWIDKEGNVQGFGKTPPSGRSDLKGMHFTGYQVLSKSVFARIPPGKETNIFYDILMKAIAEGSMVTTVVDQGHWLEMGNAADFLEASKELIAALQSGEFSDGSDATCVRSFLAWGWKTFDPSEFKKVGPAKVILSKKAQLPPSVEYSGDVVIGGGVNLTHSKATPLKIENSILAGKIIEVAENKISNQLLVESFD